MGDSGGPVRTLTEARRAERRKGHAHAGAVAHAYVAGRCGAGADRRSRTGEGPDEINVLTIRFGICISPRRQRSARARGATGTADAGDADGRQTGGVCAAAGAAGAAAAMRTLSYCICT